MIPKRKWLIKVDGEVHGPFSKGELRRDPRVTPETLAQKKGWSTWRPISEIDELADLFEDEPSRELPEEQEGELGLKPSPLGELVLETRQQPPHFTFWLVMALLLTLYLLFKWQGVV